MAEVTNTVLTIPAYISNDGSATYITVTDPISGAKAVVLATGYYEFQLNDGTGTGTATDPWHILKKLSAATTANWTYEMGLDGRLTIGYLGTGTATFVFENSHVRNLFGSSASTLTFSGAGEQTLTYPVFGMFLSKSRKGDTTWKHSPGFSAYQETADSRVIGWNDGNHKHSRRFSFDYLPANQNFKTTGQVSTPARPVDASTWNTTPAALSYTAPYTALRFLKESQGVLMKLHLGALPYNGTDQYYKVYFRPDSIKRANRFSPSINGNERYVTMDEVEVLLSDADSGEASYAYGALATSASPTDFSGLVAWWQADDVTLSGGKITQFNDKSGNGRHATNANTTYQVTQSVDAAYNNKIIAVANGNSNQVYTPPSFTVNQPLTIFAIGNGNGSDWETWIDSNIGDRLIFRKDPSDHFAIYAGNANVSVASVNIKTNPSIGWVEVNGASSKGNVNSNTATTLIQSPGSNTLTEQILLVGIGGNYALANGGKFAALLIYNRILTTEERTSILTYLSNYYGISVSGL